MSQKPYTIIIDEKNIETFQIQCQELRNQGYRLHSSSCGFLDSADYDFVSCYQAIFVLEEIPQPKDDQPLISTIRDLLTNGYRNGTFMATHGNLE